jgi:hypothetical protein
MGFLAFTLAGAMPPRRAGAHIDLTLPEKLAIITLAESVSFRWEKLFIMAHLYTDESSL